MYLPGLLLSGTEEIRDNRSLRPKNLARKRVACACDSGDSIHCRHDLKGQASLHPLRSTRQPLQLMLQLIIEPKQTYIYLLICLFWGLRVLRLSRAKKRKRGGGVVLSFMLLRLMLLLKVEKENNCLLCQRLAVMLLRESERELRSNCGWVKGEFEFDGGFFVVMWGPYWSGWGLRV